MKKVSVTEARNGLSKLIEGVKSDGPVLIVRHGRPVARLEPVASRADESGRLARLVRDGLIRPSQGAGLPSSFFSEPLPRAKQGISLLDALLKERRDGR